MKILLTKNINNGASVLKAGWVIEVGEQDGLALIAQGHQQQSEGTPARKNPAAYTQNGCAPKKINLKK
jgi:hypothetical protein